MEEKLPDGYLWLSNELERIMGHVSSGLQGKVSWISDIQEGSLRTLIAGLQNVYIPSATAMTLAEKFEGLPASFAKMERPTLEIGARKMIESLRNRRRSTARVY